MTPQARQLLDRVIGWATVEPKATALQVAFRQRGLMRLKPGKWLPFTAEQSVNAQGPGFVWNARVRMLPLVWARVTDALEGSGRLEARLLGIPIVRARGPEVDAGQLMRWLAELPWCPAAYRCPLIEWELAAPGTLRATVKGASVELDIDEQGRVLRSRALRLRQAGKKFIPTPWVGEFEGEQEAAGFRVPARATVTWHLPEGRFDYWKGEVFDYRVAQG